MKTCSRCFETKQTSEFHASKTSQDGLIAACRTCVGRAKADAREKLKARSDEEIEAAATARGSKVCRKCKLVKRPAEFQRDRGSRNGRGALCLPCAAVLTIHYNNLLTTEERKRRKAEQYRKDREQNRVRCLRYSFGITREEYLGMLAAQDGLCAICEKPEKATRSGATIELSVDHDHETGVVRQLLCSACNKAVGYFRDSPELMRRAALYIENHQSIDQRESPPA